jgi:hypothetical protein
MKVVIVLLLCLFTIQTNDSYKKAIIDGRRAYVSKNDTIFIYNDNEAWAEDTFVEKQQTIIKRVNPK